MPSSSQHYVTASPVCPMKVISPFSHVKAVAGKYPGKETTILFAQICNLHASSEFHGLTAEYRLFQNCNCSVITMEMKMKVEAFI